MKLKIYIFVLFSLAACGKKKGGLPNGCAIERRDTGKYEIVSSQYAAANGVMSSLGLVSPDVTKVMVLGDLVVGFAEKVQEADGFMTPGGYFLLNTKTGESREGMELEKLRNILVNEYKHNDELKLELIHRY